MQFHPVTFPFSGMDPKRNFEQSVQCGRYPVCDSLVFFFFQVVAHLKVLLVLNLLGSFSPGKPPCSVPELDSAREPPHPSGRWSSVCDNLFRTRIDSTGPLDVNEQLLYVLHSMFRCRFVILGGMGGEKEGSVPVFFFFVVSDFQRAKLDSVSKRRGRLSLFGVS